ncbi:hypothetical protein FB384_003414 [Prauserella sediminis]|uniref:Uncharacterized protein n=1 Tax=Prauserella sediminis TaxID=577680 RepID=A0A839XML3_9PSEU|nr:hypothetical protein [Prauserella sediminis]MBB3664510.1 hypothetical protein [Prauserella sediminis]
MTPAPTSEILRASPYLDPATVAVSNRLVPDGALVSACDPVAELIDAHGTETEAIAPADGYIHFGKLSATGSEPRLIGWIHDHPPQARPAARVEAEPRATPAWQESATGVAHLTTRWTDAPATNSEHPLLSADLLVDAIARAAEQCGHGRPAVTVRAIPIDAEPVEVAQGRADTGQPLIDVTLLSTAGAVHAPPGPRSLVSIAISKPNPEVVAVRDREGGASVAIRDQSWIVFAYRPDAITTDRVEAFNVALAADLDASMRGAAQ